MNNKTDTTKQSIEGIFTKHLVSIKDIYRDITGSGSIGEHDHYEYTLHENFLKDIVRYFALARAEWERELREKIEVQKSLNHHVKHVGDICVMCSQEDLFNWFLKLLIPSSTQKGGTDIDVPKSAEEIGGENE